DALNAIRERVVTTEVHPTTVTHVEATKLPCEWAIPAKSSDGVGFDPDKVNIQFSAAASSTALVRAAALESCRPDAWYFDDPAAPTRFVACPALCEQIKAASDAKIDVLLGCATRLPE